MGPRLRTVPRKSPRQGRSRATVDAILDATARVLVQEGYDRASTNRIALKAGVSVGSLYQYFPSKEALVAALLDRHSEEMSKVLLEQLQGVGTKSPEEVVRDVIRAQMAAHEVEPKLHAVLTEQIPRVGRLQKLVEFNRHIAAVIRGYLEMMPDKVVVKDLDAAVFILVATVEAVTHSMVIGHGENIRARAVEDELVAMVTRYLFGTADRG